MVQLRKGRQVAVASFEGSGNRNRMLELPSHPGTKEIEKIAKK